MIFLFAGIAVILTYCMFQTKQMMLGFPCVIFWAITGGYAYELSTALWDIYYFMFIACTLGMTIFSALAMYDLRGKNKTLGETEDSEQFYDEGEAKEIPESESDYYNKEQDFGGEFDMEEETEPRPRTKALHNRANKRRTGEVRSRHTPIKIRNR